MFFNITLYIALAIFALGLIYKIYTWLSYSIGDEARDISISKRITEAIKGVVLTILSRKIFTLLKALVLDVFLQRRIFREDLLRWFIHICIFAGFSLLLLMHALDNFITSQIASDYSSTVNPFLFLRNLFGILVILGLATSIYRRIFLKAPHLKTDTIDSYAIIILAIIMISGIFLEGTKIVSYTRFQSMVEEYSDSDEEEELRSLESYWVTKFGVVSPLLKGPFEADILAQGRELHEMSCAACHSRPRWAFMSYGVAKTIKPIAGGLDRANLPDLLWYIHFLACFIGLAYLPFSKMFHIIVSPLSILVNSVITEETSPANITTKKAMELDACTRCRRCSLWCSVAASMEGIYNENILPSERIKSLRSLAGRKRLSDQQLEEISTGSYRCTLCGRCVEVCPVSIGLRDLWKGMREDLYRKGQFPEVLNLVQEAVANQHNPMDYDNEERAMWVEFMDDPPDDEFQKEKADVVYFIGCVGSFSPAVQTIPEAFCQILFKADVDFTILGKKERCCGFPLLSAGIREGAEGLKQHNIETIREIGAKTIVFSCPSCFQTWSHEYVKDIKDIRLMHSTQFLEELISTGRIELTKEITGTVTYHDPCDLGRGSSIYAAPRRVIQSIPGLRFVELPENERKALCCGGGGDVEMYDKDLTEMVSAKRAGQIKDTGVDICTSACQQCVRTLAQSIKNIDPDIEVLDIIQLVWRSMP